MDTNLKFEKQNYIFSGMNIEMWFPQTTASGAMQNYISKKKKMFRFMLGGLYW